MQRASHNADFVANASEHRKANRVCATGRSQTVTEVLLIFTFRRGDCCREPSVVTGTGALLVRAIVK